MRTGTHSDLFERLENTTYMMYFPNMGFVFYETPNGRRPVEGEIDSLDRACQSKVLHLDFLAEHGGLLREPHVKSLGGGLRELRTVIRPGQHRVVYFVESGGVGVLLHSFLKKTQKTPDKELEKARSRVC